MKTYHALIRNTKSMLPFLFTIIFFMHASSQMKFSRNAKITFYSKAPIENIEAVNNEGATFFDTQKGEFAFVVLIRSFKFKKALMEEHFNENYLESNKYPKANFKGVITDLSKIDFLKDGTYPVIVKGDLTIHGVTKTIEVPGTVVISGDHISANSKFNVNVKEYNIKIPATVINNIAEVVEVKIECKYETFNKPSG